VIKLQICDPDTGEVLGVILTTNPDLWVGVCDEREYKAPPLEVEREGTWTGLFGRREE